MASDLEKIRLENIERNAKQLAELGIVPSSSQKRQKSNSNSKKRKATEAVSVKKTPTRQSNRIAALEAVNYKEARMVEEKEKQSQDMMSNPLNEIKPKSAIKDIPIGSFKDLANEAVEAPTAGLLEANIDACLSTYLGVCVESYGKAAVMQIANNGKVPRFNKYSGVAEWSNALFLWVNMGGGTGYSNTFSLQARHMMWYGGSKMHGDSRIVQRLKTDVDKLLFVRKEGGGYCCLGRVGAVAADYDVHPIAIKWSLLDYDQLTKSSDYFIDIAAGVK